MGLATTKDNGPDDGRPGLLAVWGAGLHPCVSCCRCTKQRQTATSPQNLHQSAGLCAEPKDMPFGGWLVPVSCRCLSEASWNGAVWPWNSVDTLFAPLICVFTMTLSDCVKAFRSTLKLYVVEHVTWQRYSRHFLSPSLWCEELERTRHRDWHCDVTYLFVVMAARTIPCSTPQPHLSNRLNLSKTFNW